MATESKCRFCYAEIIWCKTPDGVTLALNLHSSLDGCYKIVGANTAVFVDAADRDRFRMKLHEKHNPTCDFSSERATYYARAKRKPGESVQTVMAGLGGPQTRTVARKRGKR